MLLLNFFWWLRNGNLNFFVLRNIICTSLRDINCVRNYLLNHLRDRWRLECNRLINNRLNNSSLRLLRNLDSLRNNILKNFSNGRKRNSEWLIYYNSFSRARWTLKNLLSNYGVSIHSMRHSLIHKLRNIRIDVGIWLYYLLRNRHELISRRIIKLLRLHCCWSWSKI